MKTATDGSHPALDNRLEPVSSQTTTTIRPTRNSRGERGSGTTITIDLSDQPDLLTRIRVAAKADDREPSKWLRRAIVNNADYLFAIQSPEKK
jgi:hypothetical protein